MIPFSLLGLAALASRLLPDRMLVGIEDLARETSFVAYDEATIDELYYLAQEHANREVGPGKEAYQRQGRRNGHPTDRRRIPKVVALDLQSARPAALVAMSGCAA